MSSNGVNVESALRELEQRIGTPPAKQNVAVIKVTLASDERMASARNWLVLKGIPAKAATNAYPDSIARAYASQSYLNAWRSRIEREGDSASASSANEMTADDIFEDEGSMLPPPTRAATTTGTVAASSISEDRVRGIAAEVTRSALDGIGQIIGQSVNTKFASAGGDILKQAKLAAQEIAQSQTQDVATRLRQEVAEQVKQSMEALGKQLSAAIAQEVGKTQTQVLQVEVKTAEKTTTSILPRQHKLFPRLLRRVNTRDPRGNRLNIWIAGPAGSGKTSAAEAVARALGLKFYFNGALDSEYKLLGFTDAQGRIVSRPFREAFLNGGVYLFDEIDASLPPAVMAFQAATSIGKADFPDGCFDRHPDCCIIAAGNTMGEGANTKYVGRYKQDAAFADRWAFIKWDYDEELERHAAQNDAWVARVQSVRKAVAQKGFDVVVSPRASIIGASILAAGGSWQEAEEECIIRGMKPDQWQMLLGIVGNAKGQQSYDNKAGTYAGAGKAKETSGTEAWTWDDGIKQDSAAQAQATQQSSTKRKFA